MALTVRNAVEAWKNRPPRPSDIPLEAACSLIGKKEQPFEAKRTGTAEWVICRAKENTPAIFSYAATFASSDPYDTGNLVMINDGDPEPPDLGRMERVANFKCNYSYSFDTTQDCGLFGTQYMMDTYMETVPGFNVPHPRPRRVWQSGSGPSGTSRFWMRVPMFLKLRDREWKGEPPSHLHEWVKEADRKSRTYRANPCRPSVFGYEGGILRDINECNPPELRRGDGVALTFSISYIIGHKDWYPTYALIDIIRIATEGSSPIAYQSDNLVVLSAPHRLALRPGDALNGDELDDWDIEDLPPEATSSGSAGGFNSNAQSDHSTPPERSQELHTQPIVTRPEPGSIPDIMDVDDDAPSSSTAAERLTAESEEKRGRSVTRNSQQRIYSSSSPPTDESSLWSDSAFEDGSRHVIDLMEAVVHSDSGEDLREMGTRRSRRRIRTRRA